MPTRSARPKSPCRSATSRRRPPTPRSASAVACYHPILPIERLRNLETGEEQIKLAFKRNGKWEEIIVPKALMSSASKIVNLASRGVAVTSENAKNLVRYLADVENANESDIKVEYSTSKLGWIKDSFIPYDTDIAFDGDIRFKQIAEAVKPAGSSEVWYRHIRELRKSSRIEAKFIDRKSTRLNSSHGSISYAVFCLKKKK